MAGLDPATSTDNPASRSAVGAGWTSGCRSASPGVVLQRLTNVEHHGSDRAARRWLRCHASHWAGTGSVSRLQPRQYSL